MKEQPQKVNLISRGVDPSSRQPFKMKNILWYFRTLEAT
jgi:hypothetical protein